ncbi:hypothetical protein [Streptomyces profundus]|uniref:hypothetical protein n=1 Tax=Streptomyces profundus TaxID=2867410 RepID=UPI001D16153D|nr:hypothetical protein [Streptomyces sp. MA3_2.13]UED84056.1 hypothetical protein K4G22_07390 [Streptomyces sp. MA3_2.13]
MTHLTRRAPRWLAIALLTAAACLTGTGPAHADDESIPTEAGTSFRTATVVEQDQNASAAASTGDYLYWVFPAGAGQIPTAEATVRLPETRTGPVTWRLDLYDGLRRYQSCTSGQQAATAEQDEANVTLSCTLRPVHSYADPWANTPLPGAYYLRLSVADLPERDLGLPVAVEVTVTADGANGSTAVGGDLTEPLLPVGAAGTVRTEGEAEAIDHEEAPSPYLATVPEPSDGWNGGWWSDRWLWTAAGGVLGAVAALGGYRLVRPSGGTTPHTS